VNRFKGSSEPVNDRKLNFREYKLQQGDLVLFRGEIVTHWITPVMTGVREIFQWELSRI
jgi:predicted 2-oxoglutarate/Fe(II)-dependent dioxygenase YbiX